MQLDLVTVGVAVFAGLLLIGGVTAIVVWAERRRRQQFAEVADSLGLVYLKSGDKESLRRISDLPLFLHGVRGKQMNLIKGETDEVRIGIFDYFYFSDGENPQRYRQTVVALESSKLDVPQFLLRPPNFFDKIGSMVGLKNISFDSHPEFSKMFVLNAPDEEAAVKFFDGKLLSFFEGLEGYSVEARSGALIFYRPNWKIGPAEVKDYLAKAYQVFGLMVDRAS